MSCAVECMIASAISRSRLHWALYSASPLLMKRGSRAVMCMSGTRRAVCDWTVFPFDANGTATAEGTAASAATRQAGSVFGRCGCAPMRSSNGGPTLAYPVLPLPSGANPRCLQYVPSVNTLRTGHGSSEPIPRAGLARLSVRPEEGPRRATATRLGTGSRPQTCPIVQSTSRDQSGSAPAPRPDPGLAHALRPEKTSTSGPVLMNAPGSPVLPWPTGPNVHQLLRAPVITPVPSG